MLRALCLSLPLLLLTLVSASAEGASDPGRNAALTYWQAFATLPKVADAEQRKINLECVTMPLDAHAREVVARAEYALQMMHYGAALPRCEWDIRYEEGIGALLPHADGVRLLSSLACLRARQRFEEGRSAEAIDDLVAALTMGRHASQDGVLIMTLFGYWVEHHLIETLALYLPRLSSEATKDLKKRLNALPPGGSPATAMKFEEKSFLDWFVRVVKEAKDKDSLLVFLGQFAGEGSPEKSREKGRVFLEECGGTTEGVLRCAEETRQSYAAMAKILDLPLDQFEEEFDREVKKRDGSNPVFHTFFPALGKVRWAKTRIDVRRALLSAALAVQLDGRDALMKHPDPVVGGPFDNVAFEGGFELRSKLKLDGRLRSKWNLDERGGAPLTLTVGQHGK